MGRRKRSWTYCHVTGKKYFYNEQVAEEQLERMWRCARGKVLPTRSYQCQFCGGWHLTKQPYKER